MFNTITIATKKYVPVQDRAKLYAFGGTSPRAKRFVAKVRQLVVHDGATNAGSIPACLDLDEPLNLPIRSSKSPTLEDIIEEFQSK
tara:strand:- start:193 stop:450 length:258 start_codon:yes stop_codon:yes gene_type:complete